MIWGPMMSYSRLNCCPKCQYTIWALAQAWAVLLPIQLPTNAPWKVAEGD